MFQGFPIEPRRVGDTALCRSGPCSGWQLLVVMLALLAGGCAGTTGATGNPAGGEDIWGDGSGGESNVETGDQPALDQPTLDPKPAAPAPPAGPAIDSAAPAASPAAAPATSTPPAVASPADALPATAGLATAQSPEASTTLPAAPGTSLPRPESAGKIIGFAVDTDEYSFEGSSTPQIVSEVIPDLQVGYLIWKHPRDDWRNPTPDLVLAITPYPDPFFADQGYVQVHVCDFDWPDLADPADVGLYTPETLPRQPLQFWNTAWPVEGGWRMLHADLWHYVGPC